MDSFRNTVCIVTGSARGLGKEFAKRLLLEGGKVCISDIKEDLGKQTAQDFASTFGTKNVHFVKCDVRNREDVCCLFTETERYFMVSSVNILVNNAGVMGDNQEWENCIGVNLLGVLNGSTVAFERMESGVVANISSILGLFCTEQPKGWAYNTGKSAVVTASRCMAAVKPSIRVVCLCPSVTQTPILQGCTEDELEEMAVKVGGILSPDKVADAFETLVKKFRTGSVVAVWKDCPPYQIPDTGMALFVVYTTIAMIFRFLPRSFRPDVLRPWPHLLVVPLLLAAICLPMFGIIGKIIQCILA